MSDKDNKNSGNAGGQEKKTLSLKTGPAGAGRPIVARSTRSVVVERRTRRVVTPGASGSASARPHGTNTLTPSAPRPPAAPRPGAPGARRPASQQSRSPSGQPARSGLTSQEASARARALQNAAARQAEEAARAQADELRRKQEDERRAAMRREAEEKRVAEEREKARREEEERAAAAKPAGKKKAAEKPADPVDQHMPPPPPPSEEDGRARRNVGAPQKNKLVNAEELERARRNARPQPSRRGAGDANRNRSRLTVTSALNQNERRGPSLAATRRRRDKQKGRPREAQPKISREVTIPEAITVQELANRMAERAVDVIKLLMQQGQMATINDILDTDTAELIATELGHTVKRVAESDVEEGLFDDLEEPTEENQKPRAPVVTIMGHVDHGKTSLLDALRNANVVAGEAGGITQHIGAYQVQKDGRTITFLDTPGHEAFTSMRARGAQATDIAILVVAADDGVMPQTIESIKHAKAAEVPIIVAINKIDKPGADPNRVRTELLQHEIFVESMGGDVLEVEVSATEKTNLDKLLDAIMLQAELLELKANPSGPARGIVIEAKLDKGRGAVATMLVKRGELRVGDIVVAGSESARVRALINDKGQQVKTAGPSTPVEVLGFTGVPAAGDLFAVVPNEARAREVTEYRQRVLRERSGAAGATSLEQMMSQLKSSEISRVPLVVKADVQGSVEAIVSAVEKLGTDEVSAQVLLASPGGITESDVILAKASGAVIIGFNVRANRQARELARNDGIEIRYYNVIYDLVDDVRAAMSGLLSPEIRETFLGNAQILEVFNITKVGKVAGCRVTDGTVERGAGVRLIRDDVVIHEGKLSTLKRFKDEVNEVVAGQECGMAFENYQDMHKGDVIE
ncbi:MAG TPA: translation initiation factor IF-2, partial [Rhodobacteraceae bacterium]|nr:translation initiation factor IF-2 [Paracoccaceae bacterium]